MPTLQKMSGVLSPCKDFVLTKENASVVRSIILSYERDGCTLDEIKRGYLEHEGVKLQHKLGDNELRKIIESIEFVRSHERATGKGMEIFYYSEHPGQAHLAKLIRKQKPNKTQSPNIRNQRSYRHGKTFWRSNKPRASSSIREDNSKEHSPASNHSCRSSLSDIKTDENMRTCITTTMHKFIPRFHGCPLIGDDFFTTLATLDLGYPKSTRTSKVDSTCVNGMTIRQAIAKLDSHIDEGSIIIVNLGSNDILNDKPLISLMEDMVMFIKECNKKKIIPILTTLAPMPAYNLKSQTLTNFNRFLMVNPFGCPVIDLFDSFVNENGRIDLHAYQPEPRHAFGRKRKILMWNKVGRARALQRMENFMGDAIVEIYAACADVKMSVITWHYEDVKACSTALY